MILIAYVCLCTNKLKSLDKMDKYLEIYNLLRLNRKEMETEELPEWGHKSLSLTNKFNFNVYQIDAAPTFSTSTTSFQLLLFPFTLLFDVVFTYILNVVKNKAIGSIFCSKSYSPVVICELTLNHPHDQWSRRYHQILGLYKKDNHEVLWHVPWCIGMGSCWQESLT